MKGSAEYCLSLTLHQAAHNAHDILTALWTCIGRIQIAECHILHQLFPLEDLAFRQRNVRF